MKAITVGSATIDIIASIRSEDIERMTLHNVTESFLLLEPGRKVDAEQITTHTGGGAVNAAVSLARQGFDVSTLVKVGRDSNAELLLEQFRSEGISPDIVRRHDTELTAVSVLISSHDRNAAIFTHRGANGFLTEGDIPEGTFDGADLVYVTNLSNASVEQFPRIVALAKKSGAFVATNPGILQLTHNSQQFFDSLCHIDLFLCNFQEARSLVPALVNRTGWGREEAGRIDLCLEAGEPCLEIQGFKLSLTAYAEKLHSLGLSYAGVTYGSNGAYVSSMKMDGEVALHKQAVFDTEVASTVGAGDAFASTLSGCMANGMPVEQSARHAARNAASVVGRIDAQSGLMSWDVLHAEAV